jgi:hypothetical protein
MFQAVPVAASSSSSSSSRSSSSSSNNTVASDPPRPAQPGCASTIPDYALASVPVAHLLKGSGPLLQCYEWVEVVSDRHGEMVFRGNGPSRAALLTAYAAATASGKADGFMRAYVLAYVPGGGGGGGDTAREVTYAEDLGTGAYGEDHRAVMKRLTVAELRDRYVISLQSVTVVPCYITAVCHTNLSPSPLYFETTGTLRAPLSPTSCGLAASAAWQPWRESPCLTPWPPLPWGCGRWPARGLP